MTFSSGETSILTFQDSISLEIFEINFSSTGVQETCTDLSIESKEMFLRVGTSICSVILNGIERLAA